MKTIEDILQIHPFWKSVPTQYRPLMRACASLEHFESETVIFKKNQMAHRFYLIGCGKVALETPYTAGEGMISVQRLTAGDVLGWSWLFPPYKWSFDARVVEETQAVAFDADVLLYDASQDTKFGYDLAVLIGTVMLERLQAARLAYLSVCEVP